MKDFRILIVFILFSLCGFSQTLLIDSVIVKHCDANPGDDFKIIDSINTAGQVLSTHGFGSDTSTTPGWRTLFSYSPSGSLVQEARYEFSNQIWLKEREKLWQYNNADSLTFYSYLYFHRVSGAPSYGYSDEYFYDSLFRKVEQVHRNLNTSSGLLEKNSRALYYYDSLSRIDLSIYQSYVDSTASWLNINRSIRNYNAAGLMHSLEFEVWTPQGNFVLESITDFTYDSLGLLIQSVRNHWSGGSLVYPIEMINYHYNSNLDLTSSASYNWFGMYGWQACDTNVIQYDGSNRLISTYHSALGDCGRGGQREWFTYRQDGVLDSIGGCSWTMGTISCYECVLEHFSNVAVVESFEQQNHLTVYPNPSKDEIALVYDKYSHPIDLIFFDRLGRRVRVEKLSDRKTVVSIDNLSQGVYFLVMAGTSEAPLRIVKL
jgi:hypothetical protein